MRIIVFVLAVCTFFTGAAVASSIPASLGKSLEFLLLEVGINKY